MRFARILFAAAFVALFALPAVAADEGTRLLHYADIHGNKIAFVYAGDIWIVDANGGMARRLTSADGLELFPKFSPDGRWIAFTGDYSGTRQVHVISVDGGEPRQLTYYNDVGALPPRGGIDNEVLGWTPDGKSILFAAHRLPWGPRMTRHYIVPFAGGMETPLEIPEGFGGEFSPDGTKLVYTPIAREYRTWKRYYGGRAQDVWIYDLANHSSEQITNWKGTDNQPMWVGNSIYYTSDDNGGTLNLWAYDLGTKQTKQVTHHDDWDVLWPSAGPGGIVYEAGGWIWRFDPATGKDMKVPIVVSGDFKGRVARFVNVKDNIDSATISPSGARALIEARGDVSSVPAKDGEIRNLTATPGVREMSPTWSPDGKLIAYLSDQTGEYELYIRSASDGSTRQVTSNGNTWRFAPAWSPDSAKIAIADKHAKLRWIDVASGKITDVDQGKWNDLNDYAWSPDSKWIAYSKTADSQESSIWVYSLASGKTMQMTGDDTNDYAPAWDPEGRYLYFLSDRDFNLTFSGYEFDFVYTDPTRVYAGLLNADAPALFPPKSDEETTGTPKKSDAAKKDDGKSTAAKPLVVDAAGFVSRVIALPVTSGNYRSLNATKKGPLYIVGDGGKTAIKYYDIADRKEQTVLEGANGYDLAAGGEKLLFRAGGKWGIASVAPGQKTGEGLLDLDSLSVKVDPTAEWREEFVDGWRTFRDWFYDPNMHGLDWKAIRAKYEPLVAHIAHRTDLDYIFGEMGGELSSGHVYIQSNQDWAPSGVENGLLGADIVADPSGWFRIARIFHGENWHDNTRSPLTEPGVNVNEGDFILAVDGVSTKGVDNFYRLLENKANHVVTLRVSSKADGSAAHDENVKTIGSETDLRYVDWVRSRREYVDKKSGGRIGYIHLPNTATDGTRELFKGYYAESRKDALILDDRYNGGGFIPDRMIALMERPILSYWARREIEPFMTPGIANEGPKAMLINGYASSGGDALPYYFRERKLGTIIGTRTWGGLIGLSGNPGLMDGGSVLVPTFRIFDTSGMWVVENEGVSPDIEVIDRPELIMQGIDPSLDKAIEVLMKQLEENPPQHPKTPTPPKQWPLKK